MAQKKLLRFEQLHTFPNVLQYPREMPGRWSNFFGNNNPITLELACGKGEYTVGLATLYPNRNFIGIDLKGNRIWVGAKKALEQKLTNAAFLRIQIDQIAGYFTKHEVHEIWIPFPDPQLRTGKAKKRLTHPKFLRLYSYLLRPGGYIHLKTDSPSLFHFTKMVIEKYNCTLLEELEDINCSHSYSKELNIKTHYELLDIAGTNQVHYIKFSLPAEFPGQDRDKFFQQFLKEYESEKRK